MCQKCADVAKRIWPALTDDERRELLWGATAFPFDSPEGTELQLQEMFAKSGGDLGRALAIADAETMDAMDDFHCREICRL